MAETVILTNVYLENICENKEYPVAIQIKDVYNVLWFYMIPYYALFATW